MLKYKDLFKYGYIEIDSSSDDFFILCGLEVVLRDRYYKKWLCPLSQMITDEKV